MFFFNLQACSNQDRREDVLFGLGLHGLTLGGLLLTRERATSPCGYTYSHRKGFRYIDFGVPRQADSSVVAGVAIVLSSIVFKFSCIVEVYQCTMFKAVYEEFAFILQSASLCPSR